MNTTLSRLGISLLAAFISPALLAANLPFINDRWLAVWPRREPKTLWMRVAELLLLFA